MTLTGLILFEQVEPKENKEYPLCWEKSNAKIRSRGSAREKEWLVREGDGEVWRQSIWG